jgi:hypothetical protein
MLGTSRSENPARKLDRNLGAADFKQANVARAILGDTSSTRSDSLTTR